MEIVNRVILSYSKLNMTLLTCAGDDVKSSHEPAKSKHEFDSTWHDFDPALLLRLLYEFSLKTNYAFEIHKPLDKVNGSCRDGNPESWGLIKVAAFLSNIAVRVPLLPSWRGIASIFPFCIDDRHLDTAMSHDVREALALSRESICQNCLPPWLVKYPIIIMKTSIDQFISLHMDTLL